MDATPRTSPVARGPEITCEADRRAVIHAGARWTWVSEGQMTGEVSLHGVDVQSEQTWTAEAQFAVDGEGRVFGQGMGVSSGTEITLVYDDEEIHCLMSGPFEIGFVFDVTGQLDDGAVRLETENLEHAEFSVTSCDQVEETEVAASLLLVLGTMLETTVPFEHEASHDLEHRVSGPIAHEGVVVGSFDVFYAWTNTLRKEGCSLGAADDAC